MPARPVPKRHWRSYGDDPLPSGKEALGEPLSAFPSWFLRIECDRCGKERKRKPMATYRIGCLAVRLFRPDVSGLMSMIG